MRYTRYFGLITKEQGTMNLSTDQFQRMMNIVHIEGVLAGLNLAKEANKDTNQFYKYDIIILKEKDVLSKLTGNLEPNLLLKEMLQLSE
jgi:hypothetical protein